jgi:hypothetical protein
MKRLNEGLFSQDRPRIPGDPPHLEIFTKVGHALPNVARKTLAASSYLGKGRIKDAVRVMRRKGNLPKLEENAKWRRNSKLYKKVTDPNDDLGSVSYDYHVENPRSTGIKRSVADTPDSWDSINARRPGHVKKDGKLSAKSISGLKARIKSSIGKKLEEALVDRGGKKGKVHSLKLSPLSPEAQEKRAKAKKFWDKDKEDYKKAIDRENEGEDLGTRPKGKYFEESISGQITRLKKWVHGKKRKEEAINKWTSKANQAEYNSQHYDRKSKYNWSEYRRSNLDAAKNKGKSVKSQERKDRDKDDAKSFKYKALRNSAWSSEAGNKAAKLRRHIGNAEDGRLPRFGRKLEEAVSRKLIAKRSAEKQRTKYVVRKGEMPPIITSKNRYKFTDKEVGKLKGILDKQKNRRAEAKTLAMEIKKGMKTKANVPAAPESSRASSVSVFSTPPSPGKHLHNAQPHVTDLVRAHQTNVPKKQDKEGDFLRGFNTWIGEYVKTGDDKYLKSAKSAALSHYAAMISKISHHPGHPDYDTAKSQAKQMLDAHLDALKNIDSHIPKSPKSIKSPKTMAKPGILSRLKKLFKENNEV